MLGVRKNESYSNAPFAIEPGDRLLLYTDGLTDAENSNGDTFGEIILPGFMAQHQALNTDQFAKALGEAVLNWSRSNKHAPCQRDDITFLVIDVVHSKEFASGGATIARAVGS